MAVGGRQVVTVVSGGHRHGLSGLALRLHVLWRITDCGLHAHGASQLPLLVAKFQEGGDAEPIVAMDQRW
jgi:hypothetical protein